MRDELWIKHDARSRQDGKMAWFLKRTGQEGYGVFWSTIEILHYQNDHSIPLSGAEFDGLAEDLKLTPEKYLSILWAAKEAGLFKVEEGRLWQDRLKQEQAKRSKTKQNISELRREAGRKGGQASGNTRKKQAEGAQKDETFASNFASNSEPSKTPILLPKNSSESNNIEANLKQTQANRIEERDKRDKSNNIKTQRVLDEAKPKFPPQLDNPECRAAWDRWLDHKQKRREAYKSVASQEAKLKEWANDPDGFIISIDSSRGNNYSGIFPPKQGQRGSHKGQVASNGFGVNFMKGQELTEKFKREEEEAAAREGK